MGRRTPPSHCKPWCRHKAWGGGVVGGVASTRRSKPTPSATRSNGESAVDVRGTDDTTGAARSIATAAGAIEEADVEGAESVPPTGSGPAYVGLFAQTQHWWRPSFAQLRQMRTTFRTNFRTTINPDFGPPPHDLHTTARPISSLPRTPGKAGIRSAAKQYP